MGWKEKKTCVYKTAIVKSRFPDKEPLVNIASRVNLRAALSKTQQNATELILNEFGHLEQRERLNIMATYFKDKRICKSKWTPFATENSHLSATRKIAITNNPLFAKEKQRKSTKLQFQRSQHSTHYSIPCRLSQKSREQKKKAILASKNNLSKFDTE